MGALSDRILCNLESIASVAVANEPDPAVMLGVPDRLAAEDLRPETRIPMPTPRFAGTMV